MSVAFRRESDDEHLEPKFELPIPPGPNLVTARGLARIRSRVAELETVLLESKDEEANKLFRRELRYWGTRQATAQLEECIDPSSVGFGCTVAFRMKGKPQTITIVGHDEAEPANGLVSFLAPLSRAMMGAEAGEKVDFLDCAEAIEIVSIEPLRD